MHRFIELFIRMTNTHTQNGYEFIVHMKSQCLSLFGRHQTSQNPIQLPWYLNYELDEHGKQNNTEPTISFFASTKA